MIVYSCLVIVSSYVDFVYVFNIYEKKERGTKIYCTKIYRFTETIFKIICWQLILYSPDNYLMDEYKASLSLKEELSIIASVLWKSYFWLFNIFFF